MMATQKAPVSSSLTNAHAPKYSFITLLNPGDSSLPSQRKAVRSHAASYHSKNATVSRSSRKSRHRNPKYVACETDGSGVSQDTWKQITQCFATSPYPQILGQGRIDPFKTYPVPWEPFIPELIDHYLVNMAIDLPELDEPEQPGLLRTRWFPLVMTEAATFQVIILLAASHYASLRQTTEYGPALLQLKTRAICLVRNALAAEGPSDQLIGAVAKMASYEAMFGDQTSFEEHMKGLVKMVQLRGGLSSLGLYGMLAKICVWIDRNSALLHGSRLYFTDVPNDLQTCINPRGFLAFCSQPDLVEKVLKF